MPDKEKLAEYVATAESIDAGKLEEMGFSAIADLARNASVDRSFLGDQKEQGKTRREDSR